MRYKNTVGQKQEKMTKKFGENGSEMLNMYFGQ